MELLLLKYGYLLLFAGVIVEGEAVLIAGSFLASRGYFNIGTVALIALDRRQRRPRVVGRAEERDRNDDHREHEWHLARVGPRSDREAERGPGRGGERQERQQQDPVDVEVHGSRRDDRALR